MGDLHGVGGSTGKGVEDADGKFKGHLAAFQVWNGDGKVHLNKQLEGIPPTSNTCSSPTDSYWGKRSYFCSYGGDRNGNENPPFMKCTPVAMAGTFSALCVWHHIRVYTLSQQYSKQPQKIIPIFQGEKRDEQKLRNLPKITQDSRW